MILRLDMIAIATHDQWMLLHMLNYLCIYASNITGLREELRRSTGRG